MPDSRRSRRLHDVSHLFLSGSTRTEGEEGVSLPDLAYLYISGNAYYRGYISSGISSAISSENIAVTLFESGYSMPNAGYYFSCEPEEYLSTTLGGKKGFKKKVSDHLRYSYASRYCDIERYYEPPGVPSVPHLTIEAFGPTGPGGVMLDRDILAALSSDPETKDGRMAWRSRILVIFDCCGRDDRIDFLRSAFRKGSPEAPVFIVGRGKNPGRGAGKRSSGYPERYIEMPQDLMEGLGKRMPPASTFIKGLAISITQSMASAGKGKKRDAVL